MLAALLILSSPLAAQFPEAVELPAWRWSLTNGRVAERLASLDANVPPGKLGAAWPAWDERAEGAWSQATPWERWTALLSAEREQGLAPSRRAELAVLARIQGRDADAWEHFLAASAEPGLAVALAPLFVPGVPASALGGAALADGVLLTPSLPPADPPRGGLRTLAGRTLRCEEFALGGARLSLGVSVDRDGVEVKLKHLGGGPARVLVRPPLPPGIEPGRLLADWESQEDPLAAVAFLVTAEDPEHTVWLSFHPLKERWPSPPTSMLRRPAPDRELVLVSPPEAFACREQLARSLGAWLGVPTRTLPERPLSAGGLEPLVLEFSPGARGGRKVLSVLGLAEAFLLSGP